MSRETTVLVAEDSEVVAIYLRAILEAEPGLRVVGRAGDGREAVRLARSLRPDVITMDIRMPLMDGFDATRAIMESCPAPIVVVSSHVNEDELRYTFLALDAGAVAVVEKPPGRTDPRFDAVRRELVQTVRAMAGLRVVARRHAPPSCAAARAAVAAGADAVSLVAVGASTGGPQALRTLLGGLPAELAVPVVVVQHICEGFLGGLVNWLQEGCRLQLRVAAHGETLRAGNVYFAPDDLHLGIRSARGALSAYLDDGPPVSACRPSVTRLFESCADQVPAASIGVLLTGMGDDGARGLLSMRERGCITLVQDERSAVVYGMPGAACRLGAAERVVALQDIPTHLLGALARSPAPRAPVLLSTNGGSPA